MLHLQRDMRLLMCWTETLTTRKEDPMSLSSHLQELKRKHQSLSTKVEEAQRAPGIDDLHIADLKKQKLRIKEEITRLSPGAMA
jgi:hypothetical protein